MKAKYIALAVAVIVAISVAGLALAAGKPLSPATLAKAEATGAGTQKIIDAQLPDYPLTTCLVTGEKLGGSMGEPINYVYKGRLVRFCCKSCIKAFNKNPQRYLNKLDAAKAGKATDSTSESASAKHGCCGG